MCESLNNDKQTLEQLRRMLNEALDNLSGENSKTNAQKNDQTDTKYSRRRHAPYNGVDRRTQKNYNGIWVSIQEYRSVEEAAITFNAKHKDQNGELPQFGFVYVNGKFYLFENYSDGSGRITIKSILSYDEDEDTIKTLKEMFDRDDREDYDGIDEFIEKSGGYHERRGSRNNSNARDREKTKENGRVSEGKSSGNNGRHSQKDSNNKQVDRGVKPDIIEYEGKRYIAKCTIEEFYDEGKRKDSLRAYNLRAIKMVHHGIPCKRLTRREGVIASPEGARQSPYDVGSLERFPTGICGRSPRFARDDTPPVSVARKSVKNHKNRVRRRARRNYSHNTRCR